MALLNWLNKLVFGKGDDGMGKAYNAGFNDGAKTAYTINNLQIMGRSDHAKVHANEMQEGRHSA